jgi:parallel beta-helix repeat protein
MNVVMSSKKFIVLLFLIITFVYASSIMVMAEEEIMIINADGTISPPEYDGRYFNHFTDKIYRYKGGFNGIIWIIRDNIVLEGTGGILFGEINVTRVTNVTIRNFVIQDKNFGLVIDHASFITITDCVIRNVIEGIVSISSNNLNITNNIIEGVQNGMRLQNVHSSKIIDNEIKDYITYGIDCSVLSDSVFTGNIISEGRDFGISLMGGDNNKFHDNYIQSNSDGLIALQSSNNLFVGNQFRAINKQIMALTEGFVNTWDNGSHGNFWIDYSGIDADGDGIGDTAYIINADNQDNYPLISATKEKKRVSEVELEVSGEEDWDYTFGNTIYYTIYFTESLTQDPISNVEGVLFITKPSGATINHDFITDEIGIHEYSYVLDETGRWEIRASWDGNIDYLGAETSSDLNVVSKAYGGGGGIPGPSFEVILLGIGVSTLGIYYKRMRTLT